MKRYQLLKLPNMSTMFPNPRVVFPLVLAVLLAQSVFAADSGPATASAGSNSGVAASGSSSASAVLGGVTATAGSDEKGSALVSPGLAASVGANGSEIADPSVIARVGDTNVKVADMRAIIATMEPSEQEAMAANPGVGRS